MTHLKLQKLQKGDITQQHIDILAMCWWVITFFVMFINYKHKTYAPA